MGNTSSNGGCSIVILGLHKCTETHGYLDEKHEVNMETEHGPSPKEEIACLWQYFHRENAGTLGMVPYLFNPPRSPKKGVYTQ